MTGKTITQEQFLEKCNEIHGNKYDYLKVNYIRKKAKITITCKVHGDFSQEAGLHIRGQGCKKCWYASIQTKYGKGIDKFIEQANKVHNNFYNYDKSIYTTCQTNIIISCPIHGDFNQQPLHHLHGSKCPKCSREQSTNWGYSKSNWLKVCEKYSGIGILYIIRLYNNEEEFIKIGITSRKNVIKRFSGKCPYKYEIINEIYDIPETIWGLEQSIKREFKKNFHYFPKLSFSGAYECYNLKILKEINKWKIEKQLG